jgi:hypothetical protein
MVAETRTNKLYEAEKLVQWAKEQEAILYFAAENLIATGKAIIESSTAGRYYQVDIDREHNTPVACTCPDYSYRQAERYGACKHMIIVDRALAGFQKGGTT